MSTAEERQNLIIGRGSLFADNEDEYDQLLTVLQDKRDAAAKEAEVYGPEAIFQNCNMETEQMITGEEFVDRNSLSTVQRAAIRNSLISAETVLSMSEDEVAKAAAKSQTVQQMCLFGLAVFVLSATAVAEQIALWDPHVGRKVMNFIPRSTSIVSYIVSVIFCSVSTPLLYGMEDMAKLWNPVAIIKYLPIATGYAVQDVTGLVVQRELPGALWKVCGQSKMPLTAIGAYFMLGRTQTATQIILLLSIMLAVPAYALKGAANLTITNHWPLFGAAVGICSATVAGLACEKVLKKEVGHFICQFGLTRISGLLVSIPLVMFEITQMGQWDLFPFGGWTAKTSIIVCSDLAKCWCTTLIVKRLDSIWKTLAGSMSLGATYILEYYLSPASPRWDWSQFTLLMVIALEIIAYAAAKRDEMKLLQVRADAERAQQGKTNV